MKSPGEDPQSQQSTSTIFIKDGKVLSGLPPEVYTKQRDGDIAQAVKGLFIINGGGISWRQQPHLNFSPDKKILYLNIQTMAQQIIDLLGEYEQALQTDCNLRLQFATALRAGWKVKPKGEQLNAWKTLLDAEPNS